MDDIAIALEHVDLLDGLDGLGVELLQGSLELLVIVGVPGDVALLLVSRGALYTYSCLFELALDIVCIVRIVHGIAKCSNPPTTYGYLVCQFGIHLSIPLPHLPHCD